MLAHPPTRRREVYGLAGRVLAVETDDEAAASLLQSAYGPAQHTKSTSANHNATISRLHDGRLSARFDRAPMPLGERGPGAPLLSAYYAAREVFARFASARTGAVALYGCAVEIDGTGLLILGPTTIGKTVLALHLALQGAKFLGDETAVLDFRSTTIAALARKPALRESALPLLPPAVRAAVKQAEHVMQTERGRFWYALDAQDLNGVTPSPYGCTLGAVCVIRDRAPSHALHRRSYAEMLPAVLQRSYSRPAQLTEVSALRRALRDTPFFELTLGEPAASAAALLQEVRACE